MSDPICEIRDPHEHDGVSSTGVCWRNPMYRPAASAGADPEPPPAIVNIGQEASLRDVEWFKKGWEARAQGGPSLDVERLRQAMIEAGLGVPYHDADPIEIEHAERVAAVYARLGVATEASE